MELTKKAQAAAMVAATAIGLTAGAIWTAPISATSGEWSALPAAVRATFEAQRPGEVPTEIETETEAGKKVYEAEYRGGKSNADITVDAAGALVVVKTKVKAKDLPEAIKNAIEAAHPGATVSEAESTSLGYYELDLRVKGKKVEIIVQNDGTTKANPEEDDADGEDEDEDGEA